VPDNAPKRLKPDCVGAIYGTGEPVP